MRSLHLRIRMQMKKSVVLVIFVLMWQSLLKAQQRPSGIKVLVKDKESGFPFMNDSMTVEFNDTGKQQFVSDKDGYAFFSLAPGAYNMAIRHIGYQGLMIKQVIVGEGKTAYVTMELSNVEGEKIRKKKKKGGVKLKMVKTN